MNAGFVVVPVATMVPKPCRLARFRRFVSFVCFIVSSLVVLLCMASYTVADEVGFVMAMGV
jgi:hypothetical protein